MRIVLTERVMLDPHPTTLAGRKTGCRTVLYCSPADCAGDNEPCPLCFGQDAGLFYQIPDEAVLVRDEAPEPGLRVREYTV